MRPARRRAAALLQDRAQAGEVEDAGEGLFLDDGGGEGGWVFEVVG